MSKRVYFSNDEQHWVEVNSIPEASKYRWMRVVETIDKGWPKGRTIDPDEVVQYSTDGGHSWVVLHKSMDDVPRIITMLTNNYAVQIVTTKDTGNKPVAIQDTSFFRKLNDSSQVKHSNKMVHVYQDQNGFNFSSEAWAELHKQNPNRILVSNIVQTTYYDMGTPNINKIEIVHVQVDIGVAEGLVFNIMPAKDDPSLESWVGHTMNSVFALPNCYICYSARTFDKYLAGVFGTNFPMLSVLGGKYVVANNQAKLGDKFLIRQQDVDKFRAAVTSAGGVVNTLAVPSTPALPQKKVDMSEPQALGIKNIIEELDKVTLEGDFAEIMEPVMSLVAFRNECIDDIKLLNESIERARKRALEMNGGHTPRDS